MSGQAKFQIKTSQIILPILIGMAVIAALFIHEFDATSFQNFDLTWRSAIFIGVAFALLFIRDWAMSARFRLMSNNEFTWGQSVRVTLLREFAASVLPSAIGGGGLVILFMNKEGMNWGRSTTVAIINLFLDNLFFVFASLAIFLLVPMSELFNNNGAVASSVGVVFWTVFPLLSLWTLILFVGLFLRPQLIAKAVEFIFKLKFLKRWKGSAETFAGNMLEASLMIRRQSFLFWLRVLLATTITWSARFLVVNALFMAFTDVPNQFIIFGRQLMIWLVMVVSPTPGGSGLSELAFQGLYNDLHLSASAILVIICVWRLISYYLYLLIGLFIVPRWLKRAFPGKAADAGDTEADSGTARELE